MPILEETLLEGYVSNKKGHLHTHKIAGLSRALRDNDGLHNPLIKPHLLRGGWHWGKHPLKLPWVLGFSKSPLGEGKTHVPSIFWWGKRHVEHPWTSIIHTFCIKKKGSYLLVLGGKAHPRDWFFWRGMKIHICACGRLFLEKNSSARVVAWRTSSDCKKKHASQTWRLNHQNRMTTQKNNPNLRFNAEVRFSKSNIFSLVQLWFRFFLCVCVVGWWRAHQGNSKVSSGMSLDTS